MKIYRSHVLVCGGTGCHASGSEKLQEALRRELAAKGLDREVLVVETGCFGFCRFGPNMMVYPEGVFYIQVEPEDVPELVEQHFLKGRVVKELYHGQADLTVADVMRSTFSKTAPLGVNCGATTESHWNTSGATALGKVVNTPAQVIDMIKASGLTGRCRPHRAEMEFVRERQSVCRPADEATRELLDRSTLTITGLGDGHCGLCCWGNAVIFISG